jgi:hypothetical protein
MCPVFCRRAWFDAGLGSPACGGPSRVGARVELPRCRITVPATATRCQNHHHVKRPGWSSPYSGIPDTYAAQAQSAEANLGRISISQRSCTARSLEVPRCRPPGRSLSNSPAEFLMRRSICAVRECLLEQLGVVCLLYIRPIDAQFCSRYCVYHQQLNRRQRSGKPLQI